MSLAQKSGELCRTIASLGGSAMVGGPVASKTWKNHAKISHTDDAQEVKFRKSCEYERYSKFHAESSRVTENHLKSVIPEDSDNYFIRGLYMGLKNSARPAYGPVLRLALIFLISTKFLLFNANRILHKKRALGGNLSSLL